jgi:LysM repeat protein
MGRFWPVIGILLALATATEPARASADGAVVHQVHAGQRLGSIAKRYRVSVEALCQANGIRPSDPIKPGQKLVIPSGDGELQASPAAQGPNAKGLVHVVHSGQRLGSIAKRYRVTVEDLCEANGISRKSKIKPGDRLIIPGAAATEHTRHASTVDDSARRRRSRSWREYAKRPARKGYVKLVGYNDTWQGYVIGPRSKLVPGARRAISKVLSASGDKQIDERLVRLIARVSDQFGGRPLRVVSGYRKRSWFNDSRHKTGQALDFSIPGVPNEAVRDYLRTLSDVGVGYYPNSSFVHLDVRSDTTYWVDHAGPGQAPKPYVHAAAGSSSGADD